MAKRATRQIEFGDFQTPPVLADQVTSFLRSEGIAPASVIEPNVGRGAFVRSAMNHLPSIREIVAYDVNPNYTDALRGKHEQVPGMPKVRYITADFFALDWREELACLPPPILVLGNPPWVTAAGLGAIEGSNLPRKSNFQARAGIDAITGKANFDIAESMLLKLLTAAAERDVTIAMLVKTSVARRVLAYAWNGEFPLAAATMMEIDSKRHFAVSADACLFVARLGSRAVHKECPVRRLDQPADGVRVIGIRDGVLVADCAAYDDYEGIAARPRETTGFQWRSGVKHDCSSVMELEQVGADEYQNLLGHRAYLEPQFVYPMLKGSHVAGGRLTGGSRFMLVPQRTPSDRTDVIASTAPRTWAYLMEHAQQLDRRRSSIYRNRPRFCVFGIGFYCFAPWKVAICGLYKSLQFRAVPPRNGRPVMFDDTVYFLPCDSADTAIALADALNSDKAQALLNSMVFWDSKRPVTAELLHRLSIERLAASRGMPLSPASLQRENAQPLLFH